MIELLTGYISRSLPGTLMTNPNLLKKVDENGNFKPFRGNTVVFLLDNGTKERLKCLQGELYRAAAPLLAAPLAAETFHMTLHDLANGETPDLEMRMESLRERCLPVVEAWRRQPPLRMRATWMFNMVNTSVVLGLAPADADCHRRLDAMYCRLEEELPLGYGLTPHITLAYFRPGIYEEPTALRRALRAVDMEVVLRPEHLALQYFSDMDHYTTE